MKRIYIAVILIISALSGAAAQTGYLSAKVDIFLSKIKKSDAFMNKESYSEAIQLCTVIEENWNNDLQIINLFLPHDYTDSISIELSQMTAAVKNKDIHIYFDKSSSVKKELNSIKSNEIPTIENIL